MLSPITFSADLCLSNAELSNLSSIGYGNRLVTIRADLMVTSLRADPSNLTWNTTLAGGRMDEINGEACLK